MCYHSSAICITCAAGTASWRFDEKLRGQLSAAHTAQWRAKGEKSVSYLLPFLLSLLTCRCCDQTVISMAMTVTKVKFI